MFTIYSPYVHYISTICSLYIHCMFTICSLYIHHMFTIYPQYVHYIFIVCSLYVHYIFIICLLYVQYMFTICSLYVHYMAQKLVEKVTINDSLVNLRCPKEYIVNILWTYSEYIVTHWSIYEVSNQSFQTNTCQKPSSAADFEHVLAKTSENLYKDAASPEIAWNVSLFHRQETFRC